jgi:hypothetical protein
MKAAVDKLPPSPDGELLGWWKGRPIIAGSPFAQELAAFFVGNGPEPDGVPWWK